MMLLQLVNYELTLRYYHENYKDLTRRKIKDFFINLKNRIKSVENNCYLKLDDMLNNKFHDLPNFEHSNKVREEILTHCEEIKVLIEQLNSNSFVDFTKIKQLILHNNRYFTELKIPDDYIDFSVHEMTAENIAKIVEESIDFPLIKIDEKRCKRRFKDCFLVKISWN